MDLDLKTVIREVLEAARAAGKDYLTVETEEAVRQALARYDGPRGAVGRGAIAGILPLVPATSPAEAAVSPPRLA